MTRTAFQSIELSPDTRAAYQRRELDQVRSEIEAARARTDVGSNTALKAMEKILNRYGFFAASFRVREDGVMPKKIDPAVKERAVQLVRDHRSEYPSLTAAAAAVTKQERLGKETVRRWAVQAEVDVGERPATSSEENTEIKALKAKVRRLEEDNAILKAATVFFVGELCATRRCVCRGVVRDHPRWVVAAA